MSEINNFLNVSIYCRDYLLKTTAILRFCTLTKEQLKGYFEKPIVYVPIYKRPERSYGVKNSKGVFNKDEYDMKFHDEIVDFTKKIYEKMNYKQFYEIENANTLILLFSEFENYLFKCFKYILLNNPSIMDNQTITIKELIEKQGDLSLIIEEIAEENAIRKFNLDILLDDIIEKKIHNKFYKDYEEVFHYAEKILGIKHNISKDLIKQLNFFKQIRNIYAHGDGTITRIFINKINNFKSKDEMDKYHLGNKFIVEDQDLRDVDDLFMWITSKFDNGLTKLYLDLLCEKDEEVI